MPKRGTYTEPMRIRRSAAAALLAIVPFAVPSSTHAQAAQRSVYVSALDQTGAPVAALAPSDIVIREDKTAREILNITPAADPMQISVLVDNSAASEQYIRDYREALPAFINAIAADPSGVKHQMSIVTLGERPTINTESTSDPAQLVKGAQRIFAATGSGTYLLDGIREISQGITKRRSPRPVIVAITTEGPELSGRQYDTVLAPLRESGAALHVIVLGSPTNLEHDRAMVLDAGPRESGGRRDTVLTGSALTARLKQVAAELTHQFKVTYARPQTLIPPEQTTVSSAKPGLTVRGTAIKDQREQERQ